MSSDSAVNYYSYPEDGIKEIFTVRYDGTFLFTRQREVGPITTYFYGEQCIYKYAGKVKVFADGNIALYIEQEFTPSRGWYIPVWEHNSDYTRSTISVNTQYIMTWIPSKNSANKPFFVWVTDVIRPPTPHSSRDGEVIIKLDGPIFGPGTGTTFTTNEQVEHLRFHQF